MSENIALENFSGIRQSTPSKETDTLLMSSSTIFIRELEDYTKLGRDSSFASITAFTGSSAAELTGWNLDTNGLCVEDAPAGHDTWIYEHGSISKDRIELLLHDANYNSIPDKAKDLVTHLRKKIDHAV